MMKTFKIEVVETLSKIIEVEAESGDEASLKVQELYKREEVVLDADDWIGTEFLVMEE